MSSGVSLNIGYSSETTHKITVATQGRRYHRTAGEDEEGAGRFRADDFTDVGYSFCIPAT